jgi:hypothetical protein
MNIYLLLLVVVFIIAIGIVLYMHLMPHAYAHGGQICDLEARVSDTEAAIIGAGRNKKRQNTRIDIVKDLSEAPRSKSEQFVIDIFEKHTAEKFPSVRPRWLVYNGKQLELDGYCEKLGIAVEFSGPLHTKWYPNKESHSKYLERIKRDEAKIKICRENNVRLFVIDMRIPKHNMHTYVKSRLYDVGLLPRPPNYIPEEIYAPDVDYGRS